ncbi:MAG: hypothetical protein D6702_01810 [Planctomycetota bacterium]|nr:MAG: hypothetical protein D6702_01810 [Planctomycetota bacterium]
MAGKDNDSASEIDKTSFFWTGMCGGCHPGGGPGEFDRDGELYYDVATGQFGYEKLGLTAADVVLDGDYAFVSPQTGALMPAAWDKTGVSEPDCYLCHKRDISVANGVVNNAFWRQATLRGMANLVDDLGATVPAFAAAATAGAGWHSTFTLASLPPGSPPTASVLQVNYQIGLDTGELRVNDRGNLVLAGAGIIHRPRDYACWGCHAMADAKKRGREWFDPDKDVHYAAFNPGGEPLTSQACTTCHPADMDHDIGKGNATAGSVRNDTDYAGLRTCRDCHLPGPNKHPRAPAPSGGLHDLANHLEVMSCEFCHIPFKEAPADLVVDNCVTGSSIGYQTDAFLSADPLDPTDPFDDRWYPAFTWKVDKDGVTRLFPIKDLQTAWWGDWDDNGTPDNYADDLIQPLILWRVRQITGGAALPGTTDDNSDGILEVNNEAEILAYITALKGNDSYGNQVAARPVMVKGGKVWYEDASQPSGVNFFELEGTGLRAESHAPFAIDHNVRPAAAALGANGDCGSCHRGLNGGQEVPVFDRKILVDPFDLNGDPVYSTPREMLGINPF